MQVQIHESFQRQIDEICKKYPRSASKIQNFINDLPNIAEQGEQYPGFGNIEVRKIRMGLKEYNLGARRGLRIIYLILDEKDKIVPLTIYQKNKYAAEHQIKKAVIKTLRDMLGE